MEMLTAVAAFAVAMILFSTLVTGVVEIVIRLLALRAGTLAEAVTMMARQDIVPLLKRLGIATDATTEAQIVCALTRNPALGTEEIGGCEPSGAWLAPRESRRRIDALSTFALLQRLAKTDVGRDLAGKAEAQLRPALLDIQRTFERYAAASRELFRKRAQTLSFIVAIVVAFGLNVDATRLFQHLARSGDAREQLLANAEAIAAANEAARARLEVALAAPDEPGTPPTPAAPGAAPPSVEEPLRRIEQSTIELRAEAERLQAYDLPIGFAEFPYSRETWAGKTMRDWIGWAVNVMLAGILIGLGGPFWFKVYTNLSQILPAIGALGGGSKELVSQPAIDAPAIHEAEKREEDVVTTFRIAAG
jgi:hypothetical protein